MRYISYHRVSTQKQNASGLGLEAQQAAVADYISRNDGELIGSYTEVESGKNNNRPEIAKALDACRRYKATLIIAKLDRLARNVHFISGLMESGVDFVAVDNPTANRLTVHILAAVAEDEARRISQRTKDALAAAKARGVVLGNPNGARALQGRGNAEAVAKIKANAAKRATDHRALFAELKGEGFASVRALVAELNRRGIPSPRGGKWHNATVQGVLTNQ